MSGVAKRAKLRENSPVEFELVGSRVIGTLVRLEDGKTVVRYRSDTILNLMWYQVWMVERKAVKDSEEDGCDLSIGGRPGDDFELVYEGYEDDGLPSYFGTKVDCCFHCGADVDKAEILNERRLGNWEVPICMACLADPDQQPCPGYHQRQDGCICDKLEDGLKC